MSYDELFNNLRQKLDVLGYHQPLPLAAVPLAGALFEDLVKTTESLRDAKLQLSNLLEEKSCWELGVEPYKCDNSKLLAECNALHLELIKQRDGFDEQICDYARKIRNLESDKRCLEDHCIELESQIRDLNLRHADSKFSKSKKDGINMNKKPFITTVRTGTLLPSPLLEPPHPTKCAKCNSILWARQPGGANNTEIEKLLNDAREKADQAALYKKKVDERDREIRRLNDLLSGGRPPSALAKDCCYKNVGTLSEDVEKLQKEKVENCVMIRELQEAMHEAKQRAVDLAERNKKLERELKELKDAALSVEQQANEELSKKETEIGQLCDEIRKLKRQRPDSNERRPDRSADEKRRLNERLNEMIHREKELEAEIDRMAAKNCKLKSKVLALQKENEEKHHREDKSVSTEVDEERIRLKSERDLFQKEYLRLVEKSGSSQEVCLLRTQLKEKEDELKNVHSELCHLRSQTARSSHDKITPSSTSISVQAAIIRAEREREIARAELDRVKAERDILREKLQYSTDAQLTETDRFKREIQDLNGRICQLQAENRELLSSQVPGQTHIILLKEEMEELKKRLCEVQNENCQINTRYNQLKLLHEQTERALVDYQNKHAISETNLRNAESRLACLTTNRDSTRSDICSLQNEISVLKSANATLEGEKDKILNDLDKKTEKLYRADNELKLLKTKKEELEYTVQSLESRLDKVTSERRVRESELHETSTESKTLRQQITTLKEIRDQTIAENGRLSNELADAKADHSLTKKKLKESEKEVDRLKQQLQSYVQKVQRAEDLLMQKEREREEMLDHYRTLSHDAIALEGNNQSLEMEAAEHKRQLLEAEQEIARLKQEISIKDCTIEKLEKQVSCLSSQICRLEKDLEQAYDDQKLLKADLDAIKELCEKLDLQSEKQNAELQERGEIISKLEKENLELRNGSSSSPKGKAATDILQDLLAKSRQELEEERRSLCKLAQEKLDLRKTIEDMQKKLETEREKATQKEALAKEYSVQIQEMQHNLTDDRFQKARSREESPRNHECKGCKGAKTNRLRSGCCNCSCNFSQGQNYSSETTPDRCRCTCTCRNHEGQNYRDLSTAGDISSEMNACCQNTGCECSQYQSETKSKTNSKSKSNSLKSMKSILKGVDPCKRKNLLGDVNNFLGRKSCKFEETISFDEDSDDIIVCRKRFVETKRFKGYKGDEPPSETFGNIKSSSPKEEKKTNSPQSGSISDLELSRKSLESMYSCQCPSDSETKKQSYTTGISVKVTPKRSPSPKQETSLIDQSADTLSNITMFSQDPQVESFCRGICSKTSDSTPSVRYSNDTEIESFCRKMCDMLPPTNEKMRIKPYVRRNSTCACESLKFNPFWPEAKVLQKRISSASKPKQSKVEAKTGITGIKDMDSKRKEEMEKCIRSCKDKFGSKDSKNTRSNKVSSSINDSDTKDKEIAKCIEECKLKLSSNCPKSLASKETSPIPKDSDIKGQKEMEKCIEECKLKFSSYGSNSSASKERSPIPKDSDSKDKEIEKCIEECRLKFSSNGSSSSASKKRSPIPTDSDIKDKKEMEKCIEECKLKFSSYGSNSSASKERSPIPKDSDSKDKEIEKCIEECRLKFSSNGSSSSASKKRSPIPTDSDIKDKKEMEKCIEECKLKCSSNGSRSSASKGRTPISKDSYTKGEKEMEKCIEECRLKFSLNGSKSSASRERSPITQDSNTKGEKEMEKCIEECIEECKSKLSTKIREDMIKKYKEEMEKCIQECKLKFGLKYSKNENKIDVKKDSKSKKSSTSSTSSKIKTDADTEEIEEQLALQELSKTEESLEDKSTDDSNMKYNKEFEECVRECRLKLGSKEIIVEGSTFNKEFEECARECRLKLRSEEIVLEGSTSTKDITSENTNANDEDMENKEDSKEMEKLSSPLKKNETKEDTSTEELIMKYKKEIENCIQECKVKFGSKNLNISSPPNKSIKDEDTKELERESTQQEKSPSPLKIRKSIEDTEDTSTEDVKTNYQEEMEKCIRECQLKFGLKDSKYANKSGVIKDSSEGSNDMKKTSALRERLSNSSKTRKSNEDPSIKENMKNKKTLDKCIRECKLKYGSNDSKYASKTDVKNDSKPSTVTKRSPTSSTSSKITSDTDSKDSKKMEKALALQKRLPSSSKSKKIREDTSSDDFMKCKEEVEKCIRECKLKFGSRNLKEASKTEDKKDLKQSALPKKSSSSSRSRDTDMKEMEKAFQKKSSISSKSRKSKEETNRGDTSTDDINKEDKRKMEKCIRESKASKKGSSTDSKSSIFTKSSSTSPRSKNSSNEKDVNNLEKCKRECKSKFGTQLKEKLEKEKLPPKIKEEKGDPEKEKTEKEDIQVKKIEKEDVQVKTEKEDVQVKKIEKEDVQEQKLEKEEAEAKSIDNKEAEKNITEKEETDKKPENEIDKSKLTRLSSDFIEEYYDAQDLDEEEAEIFASALEEPINKDKSIKDIAKQSIDTTSSNVCGQGTIDLLANFCASLKKALDRDNDCPQIIELKPKITKICDDVSAKGEPAETTKSLPSVIELKPNVDQITIEDTIKDSSDLAKNIEVGKGCGKETTGLVEDFCVNIKKETEREQDCPAVAALKPQIDQLCTDVIPKGKQEEIDQTLSGNVGKVPSDSNTCGKETTALVKEFCENIKRTIEKEKDCPAVIALKGKIDQFCIDVTSPDKLAAPNSPELAEYLKVPSDLIKKADDSNMCGKDTIALISHFCRIIKEVIEREKDCPLVIALKPMIEQFCIDVTAEDKPENAKSRPLVIESKEKEVRLTEKTDDSNVCGKETITLAENFCESTKEAMEREKDCPTVIELKPKIDQFCKDFTPNEQPGPAQRVPFQGCICMKDTYDRVMSIITKGCPVASSKGVCYYRQSIICKKSNDRIERTVIERDCDGSSFDTSTLPPPPIYDRNEVFKNRK